VIPVHDMLAQFHNFSYYIIGLGETLLPMLHKLFCNADATNLKPFLERNEHAVTKHIWFQCPWQECHTSRSTGGLLCDFFKSAAQIQDVGGVIYLGLLDDEFHHHSKYELCKLLDLVREYGYKTNTDRHLIHKCLEFGYKHYSQSGHDFSEGFKGFHITYIFTKILCVSTLSV